MTSSETHPGAVILAGGLGVRLGQDKASVQLCGETLLERAVRRMSLWTDHIIVVERPQQGLAPRGVKLVCDLEPYEGVLAGMAAGIAASEREWNIVVACDMPFVKATVLDLLTAQRDRCDAVVPRVTAGFEPLHALYHRRCVPSLMTSLRQGRRRVASFYDAVSVREVQEETLRLVDSELGSFVNINTPQDLELARNQLRDE